MKWPTPSLGTILLPLVVYAQQPNANSIVLVPNQTLADAGYDVSQVLSPSFVGMGIEPSNLFSFTGGDTPNNMSINLLANLANYTGVPPRGNTQDYFYYNASFADFYLLQNPSPQGHGAYASDSLIIGPGYFEALNRFPTSTPITFGLNLAYDGDDWRQRITGLAEAARTQLTNVQLVSFEIGNEPDLYLENGFRTGAWDGGVYTTQWLARAEAVFQDVLQPNNVSANFFEPGCTASTIGNSFQITNLDQAGILEPALNGSADGRNYVAAFNQHDYYYYIGVSKYTLNMDLFQNLQGTRAQFAAWVDQTQQSFNLFTPFVLREMASAGPVGLQGISETYGAALWQLDFFLYTATLNVSSVQIHMTDNSFAAPWQPIDMYDTGPHVRPSYYSFAAMAQIIGAGCNTRIQELPVTQPPADYGDRLGAYTVFRGDDVAAVIVINTMISNVTTTSKNYVAVQLSLPNHANANIFVSSLLGPGTDATSDTTWNGLSYETPDYKAAAAGDESAAQQLTLDGAGAATIQVRDASAVVISLDYALGTGPAAQYDSEACQGLANTRPEPHASTPSSGSSGSAQTQWTSDAAPIQTSSSADMIPGPDTTRTPSHNQEAQASSLINSMVLLLVLTVAVIGWSL